MRVAVSAVQEFWRRDHLEGDASRPTAQTSAAAVARAGAGTRGTTGSASTGAAKPAQELRCKFCKRGPFENKRGLTMHQVRNIDCLKIRGKKPKRSDSGEPRRSPKPTKRAEPRKRSASGDPPTSSMEAKLSSAASGAPRTSSKEAKLSSAASGAPRTSSKEAKLSSARVPPPLVPRTAARECPPHLAQLSHPRGQRLEVCAHAGSASSFQLCTISSPPFFVSRRMSSGSSHGEEGSPMVMVPNPAHPVGAHAQPATVKPKASPKALERSNLANISAATTVQGSPPGSSQGAGSPHDPFESCSSSPILVFRQDARPGVVDYASMMPAMTVRPMSQLADTQTKTRVLPINVESQPSIAISGDCMLTWPFLLCVVLIATLLCCLHHMQKSAMSIAFVLGARKAA
jgi:hypothetical protein